MVARSGGFFSAPVYDTRKQGSVYEYIHVGGELFRAVAVTLIDYLQSDAPVNDMTLKKILGCFSYYFPQYITNDTYLITPRERMGQLLNNSRKSELVECMAYVLRQLTVDELYADPLNLAYRELFAGLSVDTPKSYLRDVKTSLPTSALNALGKSLNLPMILSFNEIDKELRKREATSDDEQPALFLQIQGNKYYPGVKRKTDFIYVGQLAVTVKPAMLGQEQEESMVDILAAITEDNRKLLHAYTQQRHAFLSMVAADELSYEQLRDLYINFLPMQKHSAAFIMQLAQDRHPIIAAISAMDASLVNSKQKKTELLINVLASWIVAGVVNKDKLFEAMENTTAKAMLK